MEYPEDTMLNTRLTPCQERGYRVGDVFIATSCAQFTEDSVIKLVKDDTTYQPLFNLIQGDCKYFNGLNSKGMADGLTKGAYTGITQVKKVEVVCPSEMNRPT